MDFLNRSFSVWRWSHAVVRRKRYEFYLRIDAPRSQTKRRVRRMRMFHGRRCNGAREHNQAFPRLVRSKCSAATSNAGNQWPMNSACSDNQTCEEKKNKHSSSQPKTSLRIERNMRWQFLVPMLCGGIAYVKMQAARCSVSQLERTVSRFAQNHSSSDSCKFTVF